MGVMVTPERSVTLNRRIDITDPVDRFAWYDEDGLRDLTDSVLTMEIIDPATDVIAYTKTAGLIGGDGTGNTNLIIAWDRIEMEPLAGLKRWQGRVIATRGSEVAEFTLDSVGTFPTWVFEDPPSEPSP